ncbi:MAG: response regulator transcription factor [Pyrinomonadaceae bacterium]
MTSEITVLIADDHPVFQRGLREIIESDASLRVVAAVGDGETAIVELRRLRPKVAVLDVDMPKRDGLEVVAAIKHENLGCSVVLLTMYKEERFLNAALDAGVSGYVVKDSAIDEIAKAIHAAADGHNFVSPTLSNLLFRRLQKPTEAAPLDSLTTSERRVLRLVAESKSSKQIADELFISVRTVENHRANICAKLGLEGKNALLSYALTNRTTL